MIAPAGRRSSPSGRRIRTLPAKAKSVEVDPEACPLCDEPLCYVGTRHGVLLACESCIAGATTLAVLKKVAPREFVNHLWQAGRKLGRPSGKACPSCTQPLVELRPPEIEISPKIDLCLHCFLVWMERDTLRAVPLAGPLEPAARLLSKALS